MPDLKQQLADALAAVDALKNELEQTQQGLVALTLELEERVDERTASLRQSNARLQAEILVRGQTEEALRQSKEQLARANEDLERIVAERTARLQDSISDLEHYSYTITHDMRAPLRGMRGFAQILEAEASELEPEHRTFLEKICAAADRMEGLIDDALNYSRMARNRLSLEPVDVETLLREVTAASPELQLPKARIRVLYPIPQLLGNKAGLAQCFSNLLNNAVKFVEPGKIPEVRIWAQCIAAQAPGSQNSSGPDSENKTVRLWFEDNGIGISAENHKRLFQMFERFTSKYEGTGIGLALVKKAAERMQGRVGVESEPGKGSRFWLELPKIT